jgi:hypothetical protein
MAADSLYDGTVKWIEKNVPYPPHIGKAIESQTQLGRNVIKNVVALLDAVRQGPPFADATLDLTSYEDLLGLVMFMRFPKGLLMEKDIPNFRRLLRAEGAIKWERVPGWDDSVMKFWQKPRGNYLKKGFPLVDAYAAEFKIRIYEEVEEGASASGKFSTSDITAALVETEGDAAAAARLLLSF